MKSTTLATRFVGLFALLALAIPAGCAPGYHCYPCGHVSCRYSAPPPLPYAVYDKRACHSCVAAEYQAIHHN